MNKTFMITLSLLILLLPFVVADAEQYLVGGVTKDSTYNQDGTGVWTGRAGVIYTRGFTDIISRYALIGDVDDDGDNEIVILADDNLEILNYTTGLGLISEQSISHGSTSVYSVTPALFDTDGDGILEIISSNITHMLMYSWNGTEIVLNQSAATLLNASTLNPSFNNPVIKCAQGIQWSTGKDTCIIPLGNRTGMSGRTAFIAFNLDDNTVAGSTSTTGHSTNDPSMKNTHLADGDGDGYLEVYAAREDLNNGYMMVYKVEVGATVTITELFYHDRDAQEDHTDIIVNDLYGDGGDLDITFGYTDDQVNYDAATYNANTGAVRDTSYCTVLTCPEGNVPSENMWVAEDTTYSSYTGDVCYYLRNYEENDPGVNIDSVFCVSQYAGAGYKETEVSNTINFTGRPLIHVASLHGVGGPLTPRFTIQGSTKEVLPVLTDAVNVPVDAQQSGSLDIVGLTNTMMYYYDDAYTNQQVNIISNVIDTGNPVCQGEIVGITSGLEDDENDAGRCYINEQYGNATQISNTTNVSFGSGQVSVLQNYFADQTGTFILKIRCSDQYHYDSSPNEESYTIQVTDDITLCNIKGSNPVIIMVIPDDEEEDANFIIDQGDELMETFGLKSRLAKTLIVLIALMIICVGSAIAMATGGVGSGAITTIEGIIVISVLSIAFYLGWMSAIPLVLIGLLLVVVVAGIAAKGMLGGG